MKRVLVCLLLLSSLLWGAPVAPTAAHSDSLEEVDDEYPEREVDDPTPVLDTDEALMAQAEAIAKEQGRSVDEVHRRLLFEDEVTNYLQELDESGRLSDRFAGGVLADDGSLRATWYFKGSVPAAHRDDLSARGIEGIALVGGQRYSLSELIEVQDRLHDEVRRLGFESIYSSFDVGTQLITLEVAEGPADAPRDQDLESVVATAARRGISRVATRDFEIVDAPDGQPPIVFTHSYGGAELTKTNGGGLCTSAFVIRRNTNSTEGVLTAAHCEGLTRIADYGNGPRYSAPWANEHIGTWGEVEWHTTTHDEFPQFYSTNNTRTVVKSRITNSAMQTNVSVCRYGRASGRDCGTIHAINTNATFNWAGCGGCSVTALHLVDSINCTSSVGDSGGPHFSGSKAWGVHSGNRGSNKCVFSKIQNAELAFDVHVQIG